ncbi:hypothetical protein GQ44DRAFT_704780 [Phaeosphaeriaceae sp. PMI808]|nr:hypothetical protein GQ44DRAFT_704780 [Phaeosphaeriaceae sp. PMI808]
MVSQNNGSYENSVQILANHPIVFLVFAWTFIPLRLYTRTIIFSGFGWDDAAMIAAGVFYTVFCAALFALIANGAGTTISSVDDIIYLTQLKLLAESTYLITIMSLKISLGIFLVRVIVEDWQRWVIYVTVAINIISSVATLFYVLLRCGAPAKYAIIKQLQSQCAPRALDLFFGYQQASLTTLTDFIFATLPIFILWKSIMGTRTKVVTGFILTIGACGSVCSLIRFQYIDGLVQFENFFISAINITKWSGYEAGAGIIAGCMGTLRPLLQHCATKIQNTRSSESQACKTHHGWMRPSRKSKDPNSMASYVNATFRGVAMTPHDNNMNAVKLKFLSDHEGGGSKECILH